MRQGSCFFHIDFNTRVTAEIAINIVSRRLRLNTQILSQPESAHPVDQTEINHFGHATLIGRHFIQGNAKHFRGGGPVNVKPLMKGV